MTKTTKTTPDIVTLANVYIHFERDRAAESRRQTQVWHVISRAGLRLGTIGWYGAWRQYTLFPERNTVFNKGCLLTITQFIDRLMEERRRT